MSLEAKIEALTAAVINLTAAMQNNQAAPQMAATVPAAPPAPAQVTYVPPAPAAPVEMPPPPSFMTPAAPAAPVAPAGAPFADPKGLIEYAMAAYNTLGAAKAAGLQKIITDLGHANINDVRPDQYAAFYAQVEALKAQ